MLKRLEIAGFKSFGKKTVLDFPSAVTSVVGPNGSGKSNVAEAFRFALGEQSMKSMRGKRSEDLIFSGSPSAPRANRAAVTIVFDNAPRRGVRPFPNLAFDEVAIERAVYRDGASEYAINGTKARLRDVQELLAGANIGETGHHIVSQGEADRILLASPKERRSMLEDALGLKAFEFRKAEAERKLEKTAENVAQVEALRREIAPHIRFLAKGVERLERLDALQAELREKCREYFAREDSYIRAGKEEVLRARTDAAERLATVRAELAGYAAYGETDPDGERLRAAVRDAERALDRHAQESAELARELGRIEGALEAAASRSARVAHDPYAKVPREALEALRDGAEHAWRDAENAGPDALRAALGSLRAAVSAFFERYAALKDDYLPDEERDAHLLEGRRAEAAQKATALEEVAEDARAKLARAREAVLAHEEANRERDRRLLGLADEKARAEAEASRQEARHAELERLSNELEGAKREALALAGANALSYEVPEGMPDEPRAAQEERKRALERLRIRVEEAGGADEDVRREYEEATAREAFLARELADLSASSDGLRALIADLDAELRKSFANGLEAVNERFAEYFGLMFGGGHARLALEEPREAADEDGEAVEETPEQRKPGIDITVRLPKKRVNSLLQLSGGERALASIALLFAMSGVNPPPFLVLDETDAALDEANSRRYGDLIERLAKDSQLIVITHNRETMGRAGAIFGVTMGADGASRLLSVRFDEAVAVAK